MDRLHLVELAWNSKEYLTDWCLTSKGIIKEDFKNWLTGYYFPDNDDILEEIIEENVVDKDYSILLREYIQAIWDGEFIPSNYKEYWEETMY